jgi:hypothetical protein
LSLSQRISKNEYSKPKYTNHCRNCFEHSPMIGDRREQNNAAAPARILTSSPGKYTGEDNGWMLPLVYPVIIDFDETIRKYPNITRYVGGASTTSSRTCSLRLI